MKIGDLEGSIDRIEALHKGISLKDKTPFGLFRKATAGHAELAQFVMYRASSDSNGLKNTVGYFVVG